MEEKAPTPSQSIRENWEARLREFKEKLAKRLWALPGVSEKEKELVYRDYLKDMGQFEDQLEDLFKEMEAHKTTLIDENQLLRSLMGVDENDLKARIVTQGQDLQLALTRIEELTEEVQQLQSQITNAEEDNAELRRYSRDLESQTKKIKVNHIQEREMEVKDFSEKHDALKNEMNDLQTRLKNLKELFQETNEKILIEKQDEISALQKKLLDEMEVTLKKRQTLMWAEEEMFAKGIAHKVRTALVSAQGQLYLTLERLGLLDPQSNSESYWKSRLRLLMEGGEELSKNFHAIQTQMQDVTATLDDYLHLTHRRELKKEPISIKELVQKIMAELYVDRRPNLTFEFLSDDPMPDVVGDRELLFFSLKTVVENALEALPAESGRIVVALKNNVEEGRVGISVQDSGQGIDPHHLDRLFQPFFTTKNGRQGLNLSRAKRYIEHHGGELNLIKTDQNGTLFDIFIPIQAGL